MADNFQQKKIKVHFKLKVISEKNRFFLLKLIKNYEYEIDFFPFLSLIFSLHRKSIDEDIDKEKLCV